MKTKNPYPNCEDEFTYMQQNVVNDSQGIELSPYRSYDFTFKFVGLEDQVIRVPIQNGMTAVEEIIGHMLEEGLYSIEDIRGKIHAFRKSDVVKIEVEEVRD